jgi:predicted DNA-binding protein
VFIYLIDTNFYLFQQAAQEAKLAEMEQKLLESSNAGPVKFEVVKKPSTTKIQDVQDWSLKIDKTGKIKIGKTDNAFSNHSA